MPFYDWKTAHARRRKKARFRFFGSRPVIRILQIVCGVTLAVSLYLLGDYILDDLNAKKVSRELRAVYYAETEAPTATAAASTPVPPLESAAAQTEVPAAPLMPIRTPYVPVSNYPGNPYLAVRSTFTNLQKQNPDIIAWLNVEGLLDEAVVQRDNTYYLTRDYRGKHNDNGALFLDESCSLQNRPSVYVVFGHNMKSDAMFGCLHKYEKSSFYKSHACLTYDTIYEEGEFAIFSVSNLSVATVSRAISLSNTGDPDQMVSLIRELQFRSLYQSVLDVNGEDQLLLLVTCNGDDNQRRVVAARRLREGETRESIRHLLTTGQ